MTIAVDHCTALAYGLFIASGTECMRPSRFSKHEAHAEDPHLVFKFGSRATLVFEVELVAVRPPKGASAGSRTEERDKLE